MSPRRLVAAVAVLLSPFAFAQDGPDMRELVKEFRAAMKSREVSERLAAVEAVSGVRDEDVADALAKELSDRNPRVRAAVARALGAQGETKHVKALLGRVKRWERDDPEAVVGYLDGLAALPDRAAIGPLVDLVRKILSGPKLEGRRVGVAAIGVLGNIREKESIEELVDLLDLTRPLGAAAGYVSEEVRVFRTAHRAAAFSALEELTGRHILVTDVWQSWFKVAARKFEFEDERPDPDSETVYEAEGYGFTLEKPSADWHFTRPEQPFLIVKLGHPLSRGSRATVAELFLEAYAISEYSVQTPAQAAADMDSWARNTGFRTDGAGRPGIREGPEHRAATIAGQEGLLWRVAGVAASGKDVVLRKFFFCRDTLLYTLTIEERADVSDEVAKELEAAIASLKFDG